jgi:pimeloyl-ACP methyl ester carboxylesterase
MRTLFILLILFITNTTISQTNIKDMLSDYSFPSKSLQIDDLTINYIHEGKGETTLLFLHGLSSNADAWSKNIEVLKEKFTCVAIDLPGFGKSTIEAEEYTPTFFANIAHKVIEKLNLKNVILVGHSMGGQASIKYALLYPENIEKLILVAPAGVEQFTAAEATILKTTYTPQLVINTSDAQIENNYKLNFYQLPEDSKKMIDDRKAITKADDFKEHAEAIVKSIGGMLDDPVSMDLEKVKHPTLIIFGEKDLLIPNRYFHPSLTTQGIASKAIKSIPKSTKVLIPESGHFVQFEKPTEVNNAIIDFIEN